MRVFTLALAALIVVGALIALDQLGRRTEPPVDPARALAFMTVCIREAMRSPLASSITGFSGTEDMREVGEGLTWQGVAQSRDGPRPFTCQGTPDAPSFQFN